MSDRLFEGSARLPAPRFRGRQSSGSNINCHMHRRRPQYVRVSRTFNACFLGDRPRFGLCVLISRYRCGARGSGCHPAHPRFEASGGKIFPGLIGVGFCLLRGLRHIALSPSGDKACPVVINIDINPRNFLGHCQVCGTRQQNVSPRMTGDRSDSSWVERLQDYGLDCVAEFETS